MRDINVYVVVVSLCLIFGSGASMLFVSKEAIMVSAVVMLVGDVGLAVELFRTGRL